MTTIQPMHCHATSGEVLVPDANANYTILYFYPKDDTPGCTQEGKDFTDRYDDILSAGAVIYGVSRDSVDSHHKFCAKYAFPFPLISDPDETLCRAFDVMKLKKNYGREYMGVDRSTFIVDKTGAIVSEWRSVRVPGHVDAVVKALQAL